MKPNQEGMYQHFRAIAKHVDLPIVLYNVPGRTGVSIQPETIKRIVDECPNVVGIKDATGNWDQVTKEKTLLPDDFMIYSGDDAFTLPILAGGGVGVISVASHVIGDDLLAMVDAFEKGDLEKAKSPSSENVSYYERHVLCCQPDSCQDGSQPHRSAWRPFPSSHCRTVGRRKEPCVPDAERLWRISQIKNDRKRLPP